jgi:hypothetical protein
MPTPWQPGEPGRPFTGDYQDSRTAEQLALDQQRVRRQVSNLERRANDASLRRELLTHLRRRRAERPDMVQIEPIPGPRGFELLVAEGELLIRTQHADNPSVHSYLQDYPCERQDLDANLRELEGRVTRYRYIGPAGTDSAQRRNDLARSMRQRGVQIAVNHVFPLGPVGKALAGPEPSAGRREFTPRPSGTTVAVVDTGITAQLRTDGWLQDTAVPRSHNIDQLNDLGPPFLNFAAGHGTLVAGIIQQVDPGATIAMQRGLDGDGLGDEATVAAAMVRAVRAGARIVNLSLGTRTVDDQRPPAMEAALEIIRQETGDETVIVAAAGNDGTTHAFWPAAFRRVVSVGGLTADGRASNWSTRGFWLACSAIAEGVMSPYVEGEESWLLDPEPDAYPENSWAIASGTSYAAPQIAGAVARICREDVVTPRQALSKLLGLGTPVSDFGLAFRILPGT